MSHIGEVTLTIVPNEAMVGETVQFRGTVIIDGEPEVGLGINLRTYPGQVHIKDGQTGAGGAYVIEWEPTAEYLGANQYHVQAAAYQGFYSPARTLTVRDAIFKWKFQVNDADTGLGIEGAKCNVWRGVYQGEGAQCTTNAAGYGEIDDPGIPIQTYTVTHPEYNTKRGYVSGALIDVELTPLGDPKYWVSVHAVGYGTVSPSGTFQWLADTPLTVDATPNSGYKVAYWLINNVESFHGDLKITVTIDQEGYSIACMIVEDGGPGPGPEPGCFILTALGETQLIYDAREWRDTHTVLNPLYRIYYALSPPAARALAQSERVKSFIRKPLRWIMRKILISPRSN